MFRVKVSRGAPFKPTRISLRLRFERFPRETSSTVEPGGSQPPTLPLIPALPSDSATNWPEPAQVGSLPATEKPASNVEGKQHSFDTPANGNLEPGGKEEEDGFRVDAEDRPAAVSKVSEAVEVSEAEEVSKLVEAKEPELDALPALGIADPEAPRLEKNGGLFGKGPLTSPSRSTTPIQKERQETKETRVPKETQRPKETQEPPALETLKGNRKSPTRKALIAYVSVAAITSALVTAWVVSSDGRKYSANPKGLNQRLELEIARKDEEFRRQELERRTRVIADEDGSMTQAMNELLTANNNLEAQNSLSIDQALDLDEKLAFFTKKHRQIAERPGTSDDDRAAAEALVQQGDRYRKALEQILSNLEQERTLAAQRAAELSNQLRIRELKGKQVRVIHDQARLEDARQVAEILSQAGAEARLFPAEVSDTSPHKGRLFYHESHEEQAARLISDLVEDIEFVRPQAVGLAQPFLSLWIVSESP